jgi:hypothetical protein
MLVNDYRVQRLPISEVQQLATSWRERLNQHFLGNCLDILALFRAVGDAVGWPIKVEVRPDDMMGRANAFVAKGGGTVFVRESLVTAATNGDPEAVFDSTHELAHVILHRKVEVPLARMATRNNRLSFLQADESAENQANVFARTFLMTDEEVALFPIAEALAENCYVPFDQAVLRIAEHDITTGQRLRQEKRRQISREVTEARLQGYEPLPCSECRNLTLLRSGTCTTCATCGDTSGC